MRHQVICEHPTLILNRGLLSFLGCGTGYYTFDGGLSIRAFGYKRQRTQQTTNDFRSGLLTCLSRSFSHLRQVVDKNRDLIDKCFFLQPDTGEAIPIFVEVPCGHCIVCQDRKRNAFGYRCEAETLMHDHRPMFITLTYSPAYRPKDCKLDYRHVQNFLKRLRMRIQREYKIPDVHLRYTCCGEYTPTHRYPHYHLILWGLPYIRQTENRSLYRLIDKTWSVYSQKTKSYQKIGRTQVKPVFNSKNLGLYVGKYVVKYVTGSDNVGDEFLHSSSRNGGIGSSWIQSIKHVLLDHPDVQEISYSNKFNGKVKKMPMVKYFVDKVFPTVSMHIPQKLRESFSDYQANILLLQQHKINVNSYLQLFSELGIKMPGSLVHATHQLPDRSADEALELISFNIHDLQKFAHRDYSDADHLAERRNLYFSQLSRTLPKIDVFARADRIKHQIAIEHAKYINC